MTAAAHTLAPPRSTGSRAALWAARVVLGLLGAVKLVGAVFFTFYAAPEEGGVVSGVDWLVALWAIAAAAGFLVSAVALGAARPFWVRLTIALLLSDVIFGAVKLFGYGETTAWLFLGVEALVLLLLALGTRGGRTEPRQARSDRATSTAQ